MAVAGLLHGSRTRVVLTHSKSGTVEYEYEITLPPEVSATDSKHSCALSGDVSSKAQPRSGEPWLP